MTPKKRFLLKLVAGILLMGVFSGNPTAGHSDGGVVRAAPKAQVATHIVISEFRTLGPGTPTLSDLEDEFVELFNPTGAPVDISGWMIKISISCGAISPSVLVTFPPLTSLASGQHYLIAVTGATIIPVPDLTFAPGIPGIADEGGIALVDVSNNVVDAVGMCATTAYKEGTFLPQLTDPSRSYERRASGGLFNGCYDSDNNAKDFYSISPATPENSSAPFPIPCPAVTHTLSVSLSGTSSGSVASSPPGIDCGTACSAAFLLNDNVSLTAAPAPGWNFSSWSGDVTSIANPIYVTMTGSKTVSANFTAITFTISGNAGVGGATLSYTDGTPKTAIADGSGNYSFRVSYNWSRTVTPSKAGYTFTPANHTYPLVQTNPPPQDYTARPVLLTISGNAGVGGATLSYYDGYSQTATADSSGNYSFRVSYNWSGTVTPSKPDYTFTPAKRSFIHVITNKANQNYTATRLPTPIPSRTPTSKPTRTPTRTPLRTPTPTPILSDYSSPTPLPAVLFINEFLPHPLTDWNADGVPDFGDEYIEIMNIGKSSASLLNWKLMDDGGSRTYYLPDITLLPRQITVFFASETGISLSDGGDAVQLLDPYGQLMDVYNYPLVESADRTWCRLPDGNGQWRFGCWPTPGLPNTLSAPGRNDRERECLLADTVPVSFRSAECPGSPGVDIWSINFWNEGGVWLPGLHQWGWFIK